MSYKFYCTHCGQHIEAPEDTQGSEVICPTCTNRFVAPLMVGKAPGAAIAMQPPPLPKEAIRARWTPIERSIANTRLRHFLAPAWLAFFFSVEFLSALISEGPRGLELIAASSLGGILVDFVGGGVLYALGGGWRRKSPGFTFFLFFLGGLGVLALRVGGQITSSGQ